VDALDTPPVADATVDDPLTCPPELMTVAPPSALFDDDVDVPLQAVATPAKTNTCTYGTKEYNLIGVFRRNR
jgi:hypothetical protein